MSQPKINPATGYVHYEEPEHPVKDVIYHNPDLALGLERHQSDSTETDADNPAPDSDPETTEDSE